MILSRRIDCQAIAVGSAVLECVTDRADALPQCIVKRYSRVGSEFKSSFNLIEYGISLTCNSAVAMINTLAMISNLRRSFGKVIDIDGRPDQNPCPRRVAVVDPYI